MTNHAYLRTAGLQSDDCRDSQPWEQNMADAKDERRIKRNRKAQDRARHDAGDTHTEPTVPMTKKERSLKAKAKKDVYWIWAEACWMEDTEERVFKTLLSLVNDDFYHRVEREVYRKELWKLALN